MHTFRIALCTFLFCTSMTAASADFPASRYPFQPNLLVNNNSGLCGALLKDAKQHFFDEADVVGHTTEDQDGIEWLEWDESNVMQSDQQFINQLDLDLDNNGEKQVVLMYYFEHSWRGNNYYAYVFPSIGVVDRLKTPSPDNLFKTLSSFESRNAPKTTDFVQYYPEATLVSSASSGERVGTGSNWRENSLFRWKQRYFFFDDQNEFGQLRQSERSVYRLRADGKVELQCRIQAMPDRDIATGLLALPGFSSFHRIISTIGEGGEDGGTLHAGYTHNYEASAATARAAYRPWSVSRASSGEADTRGSHSYFKYSERLMQFLGDWSYQDAWSRREYLTFMEHIAPAKSAMKGYLESRFGMSPKHAELHANQVVEEIIGNWIQVPNYYDHEEDLYTVEYHPLAKALLEHDVAAQSLISDFEPREYNYNDKLDSFVIDAIEWPKGLAWLLKAGANPNTTRDLGKTPLMMAAHMNRPDTVRMLLKHGANPNLVTKGLQRDGRSALMYAAENASPLVMSILLDAGADPKMVDSQGSGLEFYLKSNPRLSDKEKLMDIRTIVASRKANPLPPAFDCKKAGERVERLICQDEILTMYESEMSEAYFRLIKLTGAEAKQDQVRWVKERRKSCMLEDRDQTIGCLQQMAQARERYLHNRLAEY